MHVIQKNRISQRDKNSSVKKSKFSSVLSNSFVFVCVFPSVLVFYLIVLGRCYGNGEVS